MTRPIGGKSLYIGVRQGLLDAKHTRAMGKAILLFEWLVCRQTRESGVVLGGKALTYSDIAADTGWNARTIRRWMDRLRELQYVSVKHSVYRRMVIHIMNQKKFDPSQASFGFHAAPLRPEVAESLRPEVADHAAKSGRINHDFKKEYKKQENPSRAARAGDARFQPFVEFAAAAFRSRCGEPPIWGSREFKSLKDFLSRASGFSLEELVRRFAFYLDSTDRIITGNGFTISIFCQRFNALRDGPILRQEEQRNGNAKLSGDALDRAIFRVTQTSGRRPN